VHEAGWRQIQKKMARLGEEVPTINQLRWVAGDLMMILVLQDD
jgi:hypothetical protein